MTTLSIETKLCPACMTRHEVQTIAVTERLTKNGVTVEFPAEVDYCNRTDEEFVSDRQMARNDIAMKDAYRKKTGLLTSREIAEIRAKYGISQRDLCLLLGWGEKTIARYETHQVQDAAHDTILRKLARDPAWFLQLLEASKGKFKPDIYEKYKGSATLSLRLS